jgi:CO dehydrogenase maturation factor
MCRAHATVRGLLGELVGNADDVAIADMEAGLEHFSRGTPRHADAVVAVLEPYYRSLETGARVIDLARELGVRAVHAVANKVRGTADEKAIEDFCRAHNLRLLGTVPHDDAVLEADRAGGAVLDRAPGSTSMKAVECIADRLLAMGA